MKEYAVQRTWHRQALGLLDAAGTKVIRRRSADLTPVRRILLIRLQHLGDLVLMLPAVERARELFPQARLTWMINRKYADFIAALGVVDEIWPVEGWRSGWRPRTPRFDLAIEFHADLYHVVIGRRQARRMAGCGIRGGDFLIDFPVELSAPGDAATGHIRLVEAAAGAAPAVRRWPQLTPPWHPDTTDGCVVLHPGCGQSSKAWPRESWRELLVYCRGCGYDVLLSGGEQDRPLCAWLAQQGVIRHNRCGETSWEELAAVVAGAVCVVAPDTGIIHLARALGTATVALFGPQDPAIWGYPDDALHRSLVQRQACSFCGRGNCPKVSRGQASPCMSALSVAQVAQALDGVMAAAARRPIPAPGVRAELLGHGRRV